MPRWLAEVRRPGKPARALVAGAFALAAATVSAAPKDCAELKAEIEAKIQAQGVVAYTLEVVPAAEANDPNMVVGSCEYGTRKIVYQKNDT
ncbi:DUF1161 domain-containing protein [Pseudomonas sp. RIT-PI-S]|uniref:DUF1161 domain-containing protein n=1 Tax=Pseudomonas sp. RIT-PI-S TaxID=3035295 RepID=UPI0021D950F1|nr:DUF1161 domain-containing protein [Pseudomonas sp. RIT-PI-S]